MVSFRLGLGLCLVVAIRYLYSIQLCNRVTAYFVVNPIMIGNFAIPFNFTLVGRTADSMIIQFKDLSIDEIVWARCFGCCQAHGGLPIRFLLFLYSVLCTVESLSLLYLPFIS